MKLEADSASGAKLSIVNTLCVEKWKREADCPLFFFLLRLRLFLRLFAVLGFEELISSGSGRR